MSQYAAPALGRPTLAFAAEHITVANVAVGFTVATDSNAEVAVVTVETGNIRYRIDGPAAAAGVTGGHLATPGTMLVIEGHPNIKNFSAIRDTGTSGDIFVTYERL